MIKKRKHIEFYDGNHTYTNINTKEIYTSVTSVISKFHPKFDARKIATNLILNNKKYIDRFKDYDLDNAIRILTAEWFEGAKKGTFVHDLLERHEKGQDILKSCPESHLSRYNQLLSAHSSLNLGNKYRGYEVIPEFLVFNDENKLAGLVDRLSVNHKAKTFFIDDWKTNKKIDFVAYDAKRMYNPISHWEDCNYSHYVLQLSLYAWMLEQETGYKCLGLNLIHVNLQYEDRVSMKFIPVEYCKEDVLNILKTFKYEY